MLSVIPSTKPFPLAAGLSLNVAILLQNSGLRQERLQSPSDSRKDAGRQNAHVWEEEGKWEEDQPLQTGKKAGTSLALQGEAAVAARIEITSPPALRGQGQVTVPTPPQGEAGPEPRMNSRDEENSFNKQVVLITSPGSPKPWRRCRHILLRHERLTRKCSAAPAHGRWTQQPWGAPMPGMSDPALQKGGLHWKAPNPALQRGGPSHPLHTQMFPERSQHCYFRHQFCFARGKEAKQEPVEPSERDFSPLQTISAGATQAQAGRATWQLQIEPRGQLAPRGQPVIRSLCQAAGTKPSPAPARLPTAAETPPSLAVPSHHIPPF
ncbi:uncharacterized protein LOC121232513 [Aquila chrysaetos chrysaetos]|uniref:uncharacterized protein LOC121232513 n=1 Tax=Aquila chrysaetos chrysaetos TaxID=223781 RepID=UPI001B7D3867|nr:uncharacterized protein LOC121232513 [Aquila chrysaetos chrysaetos]XP_040975149.1 uncharacterized protein LOC121232513 [Aquila chrysaetos chrysaetos]XP_040975150.1 uncharacterized protein LOC121232513 [Aquila chrysaetos chrysaetos]XP_040975151.1 uncharacterized protein LOC121232513 [Aquila chrysaetos chrysaetos]XP_040975152.1 uncharacterized protein LOC121232513 [Aquila chrysaetos chrysaetos]XP_040975153.1 uncharacterized protein LOC121232513 [Aquila chrysaetos chrysaetos]XP_040975154.1 un